MEYEREKSNQYTKLSTAALVLLLLRALQLPSKESFQLLQAYQKKTRSNYDRIAFSHVYFNETRLELNVFYTSLRLQN